MKILFITTVFPTAKGDTYMTSELAEQMREHGHVVDILFLNWWGTANAPTRQYRSEHGFEIVEVAPRLNERLGTIVKRASKFVLTSRYATREMRRLLEISSYDAAVTWTPALSVRGPLREVIRQGVKKRVLYVFDFFPIHHLEIGMIPAGPVYWIAKYLEDRLYRTFTTIICNFPGNVEYLKKNYRLRPDQKVVSNPLWTVVTPTLAAPRDDVRKQYSLPLDRKIAIFGGQITDGRGIEQMLEAADHAEKAGSTLLFLFVGYGRFVDTVRAHAAAATNIRFVPAVPRDQYLALVSAADVGMVATVKGVSSFSFPTKTMDYLRAEIPVVAAVESGSDYLDILTKYGVGAGVAFDDSFAFYQTLERLSSDTEMARTIKDSSARCLDEVFHVRHAARTLTEAIHDPLTDNA